MAVLGNGTKVNGKNQTLARAINQRLVIDLLENESKSCTELAGLLNLSNTAIAKIIDELEELGVVKIDNTINKKIAIKSTQKSSLGRKPILFKINENFGVTAVINLCTHTITINDMSGTAIKSENIDLSFDELNSKNVNIIVNQLNRILKEDCIANKKLLAICIVAFGIIDPETNEFVFVDRIFDYKDFNLKKVFEEAFNVKVSVVNDTKVLLIAEVKYGLLKVNSDRNASVINIGEGVSVAYLFNNKIYNGNNGSSGELGMISLGNDDILEKRASLPAIIKAVRSELNDFEITLDEIVKRYLSGDEVVTKVVDGTAKIMAVIIRNLMQILDIDVIISGEIVKFKERYINIIKDEISKYDYLKGRVDYSPLSFNEALELGGIIVATEQGVDSVLRK